MNDLIDRIDLSVRRGSPIDVEVRPWLDTLSALDPLLDVPPRSAQAAARGLAAFLGEARALPVSAATSGRHPLWKVIPFRQEATPMNAMATIALVLTLAFGGVGATAYAAQNSRPEDALYGAKLLTEDLRLGWSRDPEERLALALILIQTRTQEMNDLVESDLPVPAQITARLQKHVDVALQAAAELGDAELTTAAQQLGERSEAQLQAMARMRALAPDDPGLRGAETLLIRLQTMARLGTEDPGQFRQRVRSGQSEPAVTPDGANTPTWRPTSTPLGGGQGYGPGAGACLAPLGTCTPDQDGNSYGPGPGNPGATPGTGPLSTGTPPVSDGSGPGPNGGGNGYGAQTGQPQITPDPTQASPDGKGPAPQATAEPQATSAPQASCTPEQDGNSYGPGPGNPSVTPSGDNNSYGGSGATAQPGDRRP